MISGAPDPYIGRTLDNRYRVKRLLGRGGMGVVYEADHVGLDRRVAIKFMLGGRSDADALARFQREARAASKVIDSHVVQIFDVGAEEGVDFLVMEYLEGRDLRRVLKDEGRLAPERVIAIGTQILRGLHAIHAGGIVHRDIKPANILLVDHERERGRDVVKIMDFGISKSTRDGSPAITKSGHVVGTPQYMSPEQLAGQPLDPRSDLYAAALVLYELATGAPPFTGPSTAELTTQHLADRPPPLEEVVPGLPRSLVMAIERGLEKSPAARFRDALEFADALDTDRTPLARGEATASPATRPPSGTSERETVPAIPSAGAQVASSREAATRPLSGSRDAVPTVPATPAARTGASRRTWLAGAAVLAVSGPLVVFAVMRGREPSRPTPTPVVVAPVAPVAPVDAAPTDTSLAPPPAAPASLHLVHAQEAEADGKLDVAIAHYQAAYDVAPTPALLVQIGGLHERVGQTTEARALYERVVQTAPTSLEAAHARSRIAALARSRTPTPTTASGPPSRTRPAATTQSRGPVKTGCRCVPGGNLEPLCRVDHGRQCRCELAGRPLCNPPPETTCQAAYTPAATRAIGSCTGYPQRNSRLMTGSYMCMHCEDVATYAGRTGDPCEGAHRRIGGSLRGILDCD